MKEAFLFRFVCLKQACFWLNLLIVQRDEWMCGVTQIWMSHCLGACEWGPFKDKSFLVWMERVFKVFSDWLTLLHPVTEEHQPAHIFPNLLATLASRTIVFQQPFDELSWKVFFLFFFTQTFVVRWRLLVTFWSAPSSCYIFRMSLIPIKSQ